MANYFVISRAKPKPGYAATGLKHLKTLADFTKESGAVHCDVGAIQTGANAGSLVAIMFVEKMASYVLSNLSTTKQRFPGSLKETHPHLILKSPSKGN